ncbi:MAG: AAA family ATPase [Nitrososphaerota archaeon]|jgi:chromosome partitioning protein|nr:AAA family ATPase [Nitrososphaerota archaeon]
MTKVVSFINYKGGVGKTTSAYHIGCALAHFHDKKVLLVDADPQTNLTFLCARPERWNEFRRSNGTLEALYQNFLGEDKDGFDIDDIIWKSPVVRGESPAIPNLDLIPSTVSLLGIDLDLQSQFTPVNDERRFARSYLRIRTVLRDALEEVKSRYDYILIDCPPNLYIVTQNALVASDAYVVSALPDHLSTVGLSLLDQRIGRFGRAWHNYGETADIAVDAPKMKGIIFVRVRLGGTAVVGMHQAVMADIRREYGKVVFDAYTTEGIGYGEAAELARPVFLVNEQNAKRVSPQYIQITREFLEKI